MASSKSKIAEQAIRILAKGNIPSDFAIKVREAALLIPQINNYLLDRAYKLAKQMDGVGYIDSRYLTAYKDVEVLEDTDIDLKYSVIPANYMSLPGDIGLNFISPMKDQRSKFKRVSPNFLAMFNGLEAYNLHGYVGYWVEGGKVFYTHKFDDDKYQCTSVLMKLVGTLDDVDDDDIVNISPEHEFEIIDTLVKFYRGEIAELKDRVSDNLPQQ